MQGSTITRCSGAAFQQIWEIINDGASAYNGVIPTDCWTEPYMSREGLQHEIGHGVVFWGYEEDGNLLGVMGIQPVQDVTLIRHAYVRSSSQKRGIGSQLLAHLQKMAKTPVLIGTWADALWAIGFYEKHAFHLVRNPQETDALLKRYWTIPQRQAEVSVVLADAKYAWGRASSIHRTW